MDTCIATDATPNFLGLTAEKLGVLLKAHGQKPYHANQILKWIHQRGVIDFLSMTDLSKDARAFLSKVYTIQPPKIKETFHSEDGTIKWLVLLDDDATVEMVYIPEASRGTLCVSSQVGCSVDCSFCATGKQGYSRNLRVDEVVGQVWLAKHILGEFTKKQRVISNVVFMGMGEPLLNFDNVVDAIKILMDDHAYGLSKRKVTVSTSGLVPQIRELASQVDPSLAISLHAPNDVLRDKLVPLNKKYPIAMLLESVMFYLASMPDVHRKVTIEYTLIDGVNDSISHANELGSLLVSVPCKINLIPFNPFPGVSFSRPQEKSIKAFQERLIQRGYVTTVRSTRGEDVSGACGQLSGVFNDRTMRSRRYQLKQESRKSG